MGKQAAALARPWRESSRTKHYVMPHRVCMSVHVQRRLFGSRSGMHPHPGEVVAEALLHVLPQRGFQRVGGTGKGTLDAGGRRIRLTS
jgi:hypothetical protein